MLTMLVSQSQQIPGLCSALWYKKNDWPEPCVNVYFCTHASGRSVNLISRTCNSDFQPPQKKRKLKQDYVLQSGSTKDMSTSSMSNWCCFQ